jgi:hypothetical protein
LVLPNRALHAASHQNVAPECVTRLRLDAFELSVNFQTHRTLAMTLQLPNVALWLFWVDCWVVLPAA